MPDRAAEPDPRDASAYEAEGKSLQKLNRHREAIACADKALRLNPGSASAAQDQGKVAADTRGAQGGDGML